MFVRTDEDIAAGVIRMNLGGQAIVLPTLTWDASEEWQAALQLRLVELTGRDLENVDQAVEILSGAMNVLVDLIAAYDREHKLGRDVADLRRRYDRAQLYEVFKAIGRHEFPFLRDAEGLTTTLLPYLRPVLASLGARLQDQSGTSGPSPTGASTPALSVVDSTPSSSGSSGKRAKTG